MPKKAICAALLLSLGLSVLNACGSVSSVSPNYRSQTQAASHPQDQQPQEPH